MNKSTYFELIDQSYDLVQKWFEVLHDQLYFNSIPMMDIVNKYWSPLKISYLPKISSQIKKSKNNFEKAIKNHDYRWSYVYSYCTKSSHFSFVLDRVLSEGAQLEISSAYDIQIIRNIKKQWKINVDHMIICNWYKSSFYVKEIIDLWRDGFINIIIVIDNDDEIDLIESQLTTNENINVGFRIATEEEPKFELYTSRLWISANDVLQLYDKKLKHNTKFSLVMIHFFINSKIKDTPYYRSELSRLTEIYASLKLVSHSIRYLDIGGWFPITYSLDMEYDYEYMTDQIIYTIQHICDANGVPTPDIITEFWSYSVGESWMTIYKVIGIKQQNEKELWYFIDNSFITTLPDTRWIDQKFIVLPLNKRDNQYVNINLWWITCDSDDFYNKDSKWEQLILPQIKEWEELYIWFFHTGAYQESIGWYWWIQHCLIPAPKHIVVDRDWEKIISYEFAAEQDATKMLQILWYH